MHTKEAQVDLDILLYKTIEDCAGSWDGFMTDHVYMGSAFLRVIERCPPSGLTPYYALFKNKSGEIMGKAYFQDKVFKGAESLKVSTNSHCPSFFASVSRYLKEYTTKRVEFESLSCGHIMLSGNYAYRFHPAITRDAQHLWIERAIQRVTQQIQNEGKDISIILLKDFEDEERFSSSTGVGPTFHEFQIQPAMVLTIPESWSVTEDYLQAMSSKYRVRYKRARKKMQGVRRRVLALDELRQHQKDIFQLYRAIANNSGFNLFYLHEEYIVTLKEELGASVQIHGYFLEGKLVGFTSLVFSGEEAEAHFIGFEDALNRSHSLYLNMLYDMVEESISRGVSKLDFARTAMEIKSTVGAEPKPLYCYLRHQKPIHNKFIPQLFKFLNPEEEWVQRHPFKDHSS